MRFWTLVALAVGLQAGVAAGKTITVAADGSGDVKTLRAAIAAVPDHSAETTVIHLKPGTYDEGQIIIPPAKAKLTIEGEDAKRTAITFAYNQNEPNPPAVQRKLWGIGVVVQASDFSAHDVTFQNTSGDHGQALALRIDADRATVRKCRLLGWQDTLRVDDGRQYFANCYIEGRVDFIYGSGTAVFENCEIHSKNGGFVTAANTPQDRPFGFVFLHCKLTGDDRPWNPAATNPSTPIKPAQPGKLAFLGRPWRPFASVTYINCEMGDHIRPEGWNNWGKASNEQTARYAEYRSTGPGANPAKRAKWAKQLTESEAGQITAANVLGGADHWDPTKP
jgi:pectinesterase